VAARPICEALRDLGVLCKETHDTVIRIAPPLMISREDLDWGLERIERVLEEKSNEGTVRSEEVAFSRVA
jgi:ornithine--oxo-acid transaminase